VKLAQGENAVRRPFPHRVYLWACDRLYTELAGVYDPVSWLVSLGGWDAWRRLALAEARGRVLELGYGTGALLATLAVADGDVVGLELSPAMQRVAVRRFAQAGLHPAQARARAEQMPLAAASFDTALATFPAPYILEPATLDECRRVLRPGGRLVIVGLWVRAPRWSLLRLAPVFYGAPSAAQTARLLDHCAAAGFAARLDWRSTPRGEVAVLVATPGVGGS
jgi:SAM-dependent methyltransferase